ncbi:hypothetical protein DAPPUDRAFT_113917 [Daphnia pulex]|uniref:Uncharacterized protein n=1 Tax=Daphnia pulex TaxID=6669 RepID=E9HGH5_DAPPU|nr:hypothetical protein DAPPUDRAFT_113917 [Daphnia pulex]|eukprot:EFX69154.1 hypothetical protein DAPPUDRAFT_113917 [Daphnia pulex]
MAIARLLRHDRIEEGFRVIQTNVQVVNNVPNATEWISKKQFLEYVRTWKEFVLFVFQCTTKFIVMITNARIAFEVFRQIPEPVIVPETSPSVLGLGNPAPGVVNPVLDVITSGSARQRIVRRRSKRRNRCQISGRHVSELPFFKTDRPKLLNHQQPANPQPLLWKHLPREEVLNKLD